MRRNTSADETLAREIRRRQRYLRPPRTPPPPEVMADARVPDLMAQMDAFSVESGYGLALCWGQLHRGEVDEAIVSFARLKAGWRKDQQRKLAEDVSPQRQSPFKVPSRIPADCIDDLTRCKCEWCMAVRRVARWHRALADQHRE